MNVTEIRATLDGLGIHPSRRLGQNFLADPGVARAIVDLLGFTPNDTVVEVGPGLGALTEQFAGRPRRSLLVEADDRLARHLEAVLTDVPGVTVRHEDAARLDKRTLFPLRPVRLLGNLPYSAGGAILRNFLDPPSPVDRAVLMLQREVCERLTAAPGTKAYGVLSLRIQSSWQVRVARHVPPSVFWPRPQVESTVVVLEPRDPATLPIFDRQLFDRLVRQGFAQRRKQLRKLLPDLGTDWSRVTDALGVAETCRAEELTLEQWIELTRLADPGAAGHVPQHDDESFDVVDEHDAVVGQASRRDVHRQGLRHRAVHVLAFSRSGDLFLQQRTHLKDVHPGLWDSSAAGHLDAGESPDACARREVHEELGLPDAQPRPIGRLEASEATGWEFVTVYRLDVERPKTIRCPPAEVAVGAFFPPEVVDAWVEARPADFAPGFLACWRLHRSQ